MKVKLSLMAIGLSCVATACFGIDRTYERRMVMMESGTYAGEWAELGEGVWLSLDEKGAGEFLLRGVRMAAEEADEEGRLKRMKEENDPRLRKVSSAEEIPSLEKIVVNSQCWKTTDGAYPKICINPSKVLTGCVIVTIRFGCYEASQGARKQVVVPARERKFRDSDEPNAIGLSRAQMAGFVTAVSAPDVTSGLESYDYGSGNGYWREDVFEVLLDPEDYTRMDTLLRDFVNSQGALPRYFMVEHFVTSEEKNHGQEARRQRLKEKGLDLSLEERP